MVENPDEDTEPHVQRLFIGSYRETGMEPQGLAGVGFCASTPALPARHILWLYLIYLALINKHRVRMEENLIQKLDVWPAAQMLKVCMSSAAKVFI